MGFWLPAPNLLHMRVCKAHWATSPYPTLPSSYCLRFYTDKGYILAPATVLVEDPWLLGLARNVDHSLHKSQVSTCLTPFDNATTTVGTPGAFLQKRRIAAKAPYSCRVRMGAFACEPQ